MWTGRASDSTMTAFSPPPNPTRACCLKPPPNRTRRPSFMRYRWDFGDGSPIVETAEPSVTHTYPTPGTYQARVEVTNYLGPQSALANACGCHGREHTHHATGRPCGGQPDFPRNGADLERTLPGILARQWRPVRVWLPTERSQH
ncbi:MAG: PKD domain-containing protein [Chloroflexaceae bacterium]|nr:PKD domain-containing protein [Chloroflexaceae bacterium]